LIRILICDFDEDKYMEVYDLKKYGPRMKEPEGWIAELGQNGYCHKFGGSSWNVTSAVADEICDIPVLLLHLDLHDPKLRSLSIPELDELPICSFINSNVWEKKQVFEILPHSHTVNLVSLDQENPIDYDEEDRLHIALTEKPIYLRAMKEEDYPIDENIYWRNWEKFIGGPSFIRVLGPPIWLQWVEEETCECGVLMKYVCSIGYESSETPSGLIDDAPFFIGEGALYFFFCINCLKIVSISQST
jgi:hypothetical protein